MGRVAIIQGARTPFARAGTALKDVSPLHMGIHVVTEALRRSEIDPAKIDELAFSSVLLNPRTPNLAREIVLRSSLPKSISAHFISNNCISGLVAANFIREGIASGRISCGICGGAESMSLPTLTLSTKAERWFLSMARAKTALDKLKLALKFNPKYLFPIPPSPKEPSTGLTMGEHMEITAKELGIPREDQDLYAFNSHMKASKAKEEGFLREEIAPLSGVEEDNIIRSDTSLNKLASLRTVFDRSERGTLTAGNSSPLTDGASAVILMDASEAERGGLEILGYLDWIEFAAIDPKEGLLMAPSVCLPKLLKRSNLSVEEIDLFEIHEAFAAQVLANLKAWREGLPYRECKIGEIPEEKININGGSIAIGHPFAATGGRLILSLINSLRRKNLKKGVISVCAAGAMAAAVLVSTE